jgi:hypothetical protein
MSKNEKDLAYLRGLYIEPEWTQRFTDIFDTNIKLKKVENLTYLNAGAGNHAIEINEKFEPGEQEIFAVCESEELQKIAQAKAQATKIAIDFSTSLPLAESDFVLGDGSLLRPSEIKDFFGEVVRASENKAVIFLPTSRSFGEIFSYLWEVFLELEMLDKNEHLEKMITDLPTPDYLEEIAKELGLKKISFFTENEIFEYKDGEEFITSPLMKEFFFPVWLEFLDEKEKEQVIKKLAQKIDEDCVGMSFYFSVKATVIAGKRD